MSESPHPHDPVAGGSSAATPHDSLAATPHDSYAATPQDTVGRREAGVRLTAPSSAARGLATASLVLGISALVLVVLPVVPLLMAVVGCALGAVALVRLRAGSEGGPDAGAPGAPGGHGGHGGRARPQGWGLALAGVITSAVAVIAALIASLVWAALVSVAGPQLGDVVTCFRSSDATTQELCLDRVWQDEPEAPQRSVSI